MTVHFESKTIETCVVTVPGKEYDSFKQKLLLWSIASWVLLLASFAAALTYIFTALTSDIWWYGLIALVIAFVTALICVTGCDAFKEELACDLARKHGWRTLYPFIIKPDYQQFLHE